MAFVIGDYQYTTVTSSYGTGWHCKVVDTSKSSYQAIPSSFTHDGSTYQVVSLDECFKGCTNLTVPPSLPSGVKDLDSCFYGCTSLTTAPSIPSGVVSMTSCFYGCTALTTAPSIPASVKGIGAMSNCFYGCTSLTTPPTMPASFAGDVPMYRCFYGCTSLTTPPTIPNGVTSMERCFNLCTALSEAPAIPASVTTLEQCFSGCTSLATPPTMPASFTNTVNMYGCFYNCKLLTTPPSIPNGVRNLNSCFANCKAMKTPPSIPNGVTDMYQCFNGCSALENAPAIPASVTSMDRCFIYCDSLAGNVGVYTSSISAYGSIFDATRNDIYIMNKAGTSAVEALWKTIVSEWSNVHYEADDNPVPALSFTATRVSGMGSETPSENGEYAFINATAIVYETYLPDGWSCNYDEGGENLANDSVTQSPYWTRTPDGNVWSLKCWLSLGDTTKHTFTLQVADEITDENDNVKASQLSAIITQIIPKAYKLVDYYHDPTTDTEGMSIGKFATEANLFDVDMPALFRDTTTMGEAIIDKPYFSLDTTAQSGTDHDLYAAITALGWQNDVIV